MFDFLVMAQCEHKRLGVTLTDSQQKQPVYLSLLVDDAMGFFSGYPAVEPQLSYVDD